MPYKIRKVLAVALLCVLAANLSACGDATTDPTPTPEGLIEFTDDLGCELAIAPPKRVAAMIGSFADVWCLAGGRDSLVAAANDSWSSFDLGLDDSVVNLGGIKTPSLELLLQSQPDLVLASCNTDSNLALRENLTQAGIPVAYFDIQNYGDYLRMLGICTKLTGLPARYDEYGVAVETRIQAAIFRADGSAPSVLCIRATGSSCTVKGSSDNVLGEMLSDLGCVNIADGDNSLLEELSLEAIMRDDPDYIFVVLQGSDPANAMNTFSETLLLNPAWGSLSAVQSGRFFTLEHSLYNLKPNARWGEAYEKLADILYP